MMRTKKALVVIPSEVLKPKEVAMKLGVSDETLYDYIKQGVFTKEECITLPRGKRVRHVFFPNAVEHFLARQSGLIPASERTKRAYHKRSEKWTRNKAG